MPNARHHLINHILAKRIRASQKQKKNKGMEKRIVSPRWGPAFSTPLTVTSAMASSVIQSVSFTQMPGVTRDLPPCCSKS